MAGSELEIEPDLNKAPPHVEGDLLKQNLKSYVGPKGWRKYYFIVKSDKLQYFRKRDDYQTNKDPITYVRMSQVTEITEAVFSGVPKKHHLNCGFSVVSYHPVTQELQTYNLLAETPEDMRYWVHALRYIKAYWSKMKIRDTVLSEDQERKLLEGILKEEEYEREDDLYGEYTIGEDGHVSVDEPTSRQISVFFANGSKVKVTLSTSQTTSDLLEMSEIKEQLNSSTAHIVLVDNVGEDTILEPQDHPALYQPKAHTLYAVEHSHRLLVTFISRMREFECIFVSSHATAAEIIEHRDIAMKLDLAGVANRGLFLKLKEVEQLFGPNEAPCDVLFEQGINGNLKRLRVGQLIVKNKALGGGRSTARVTRRIHRTISKTKRPQRISEDGRRLDEISEEEEAQSKALDMLLNKKMVSKVEELESTDEVSIDGEVYVMASDIGRAGPIESKRRNTDSSVAITSQPMTFDLGDEGSKDDDRGFEDVVIVGNRPHSGSDSIPNKASRPRSSALYDSNKLTSSGEFSRKPRSRGTSPSSSPANSPPRSRSKSPRRLPDLPADSSPRREKRTGSGGQEKEIKHSPGHLKRKGATRSGSVSSSQRLKEGVSPSPSPLTVKRKGPTIVLTKEKGSASVEIKPEGKSPTVSSPIPKRPRSPSTRNTKFFENLNLGDSRSSSFGVTVHSPVESISSSFPVSHPVSSTARNDSQGLTMAANSLPMTTSFGANTVLSVDNDEDRLDKLFSKSFQQDQEDKTAQQAQQVDTLSAKVEAVAGGKKEGNEIAGRTPETSPKHAITPTPMLIDFKALQSRQEAPPTSEDMSEKATAAPTKSTAAINVASPSLLKVILLQSSEATDFSTESRPMDFINLSGVCLRNDRGVWVVQDGYNYHDPLPFDCNDHTESFPLPGGIRVVYNHTHKRWHVFPATQTGSTPSGEDSVSVADSTEHAQSVDDVDSRQQPSDANSLYLSKKMIVTEIGTAFHHIMNQFESTRDHAEKKKIGSDMINTSMGHVVRGEFCSAIAHLLLDGMRRYRFEGLVQDDVWKIVVAFSGEAQSNPSSPLVYPAFDKVIFQPIHSLKTLMRDSNVKFRTFVCLAMSKGMLTGFLEALPKQSNTLKKFYHPNAFLRLAADYQPYQTLYQQIILTLEPMAHLPFDLSIDFESRQAAENIVRSDPEDMGVVSGSSLDVSSTSSVSEPSNSSTPVRPVVVIKTHAATGQRSTAGNVKSVVWDTSPLHVKSQTAQDETDNEESLLSLKEAQEKQHTLSPASPRSSHPQSTQSRSSQLTTTSKRKQGSWWQKLAEGFNDLNKGGAITGPSKNVKAQQVLERQRQAAMAASTRKEKRVKALYNNIGEDADELTFNKDDVLVVKEQINEEWLICTSGSRSGIVPVSYVQTL